MQNTKNTNKYKILLTIFAGFFLAFSFAYASTSLYFKIDNENLKRGDIFYVDLKISSNKSVNVVDGTLTYDKTKIVVQEIKTDGSLFSIWAKNPVFDNNKGTITFVGGVPGGYKGENGQVLGITFKVIGDGQTKIDFQDVFSVYLNDGLGTVVNPWIEPLQLTITPSQAEIAIRETLKILENKDNEYSHVPAIFLLIIITIIVFVFVKIKTKKKSA